MFIPERHISEWVGAAEFVDMVSLGVIPPACQLDQVLTPIDIIELVSYSFYEKFCCALKFLNQPLIDPLNTG